MSAEPKLPLEHGPRGAARIYGYRLGVLLIVVAVSLILGVVVGMVFR